MNLPKEFQKKDLKLLGEGAQGKVYQINDSRCIKVFKRPKCLQLELDNLKKAAHKRCFPKVYGYGKDYIIREYFNGMNLRQYLKKFPLTESISYQLVKLLRAFKRLNFSRIDTRLKNVIVTAKGKVRPIDFVNSKRQRHSYPKILLSQLDKFGLKETFLEHVQKIDNKLYAKWLKMIKK